ncbi:MAG: guanylate kinase [Chitinophagaceae bacterium]|nr:guanylate kinase [Chitinophagaceae bacterium]
MQKLILLTAPSGAGKSSMAKHLMAKFPDKLAFSISAATRLPRKLEKDGVDYYFISEESFKDKIANNEFAEWEMVYEGNYYGTLNLELQRIWNLNKVPVLDIDVKGAIKMQEIFEGKVLSLFIQPPSIEALKNRLENRGTETPKTLQQRLTKAEFELTFSNSFSCVIVNDRLEDACKTAEQKVEEFLKTE